MLAFVAPIGRRPQLRAQNQRDPLEVRSLKFIEHHEQRSGQLLTH
jgi:hypothetical protein